MVFTKMRFTLIKRDLTPIRNWIMKAINRLFLFTFILSSFLSCSGKSGKTETSFEVKLGGLSSITSVAGGGAMLYGNSAAGNFGMRLDTIGGDVLTLDIPNGNWNFSLVIWDGDHDAIPGTPAVPLTGLTRCAVSLGNELAGGEVTILLSASNGNCTDPVFSPDTSLVGGVTSFPEIVPRVCRIDPYSVTDETASECGGVNEGFVYSVRYMMIPYKNFGGEIFDDFANAIVGPCISKSATPGDPVFGVRENISSVDAAANIPGGNPAFVDSVYKTVVRAYFGETAGCDEVDPRGFTDFIFPKGVNEDRPNNRMIPWNVGGGIIERAFLLRTPDVLACAPPRDFLPTDFSVGGTKFYQNGICNGAQFDLIPPEWTTGRVFNNKNFILLKNINYFAGIDLTAGGDPGIPPHTMIGTDFGTSPASEPNPYTGTFDGNGKRIVGMRMDYENETGPIGTLGFVRDLGAGGIIQNLTFDFPEIWADSYDDHSNIGLIAGIVSGGTISDVTIVHGSVEGKEHVGLVAGQMTSGNISFIDSDNSEVEGVTFIGGLIGLMSGGALSDAEFRGFVAKDGPDGTCSAAGYSQEYECVNTGGGSWTDSNGIGGIVGKALGGSTNITAVTSKGLVLGHSKIGGIVGTVDTAGVSITDSYSVMSVIATGNYEGTGDSFVGGIIGEAVANNSITRSFHTLGSVFGPGAAVGAIYGGGTGTPTLTGAVGTSTSSPTHTYAQVRSVTTMNGLGFSGVNGWLHDDDTYDFPRRDFELPRPCSGKFAGTFAGGDGSDANPFQICSAAQLSNISSQIGSNVYYELQRPIDMGGLTPMTSTAYIYNGGAPFQGILRGKGMPITNMAGSISSASDHIGLFSLIGANGVLEDLVLVGKIDMNSATAGFNAGLAAGINMGKIDRVTTFGAVASSGQDGQAIGGIVGSNGGVIIGSRGNSLVQGNSYVGGIAGKNAGGLIAYSVFGGKVTPRATDFLATYIGGIAGYNTTLGGVKNYYDPSFDEFISYDGDIIDSSVYGSLTAHWGTGFADQGAIRKGGLIVGANNGYISDIESYGRIELKYFSTAPADLVPIFSEDNPANTPAQANGFLIQANTASASDTMMGVTDAWAIGDAVWGHNGQAVKLPSFNIDNNIAVGGSSTVLPVYEFGGAIGVNEAAGTAQNIMFNGNIDYNGAQYFVPTFGPLVGVQNGTLYGTVTQAGFYYPGGNSHHLDDLNENYLVDRSNTGNFLIVEVDTGVNTSLTIAADTITDGSFGLTDGDMFAFGSYQLMVDTGGISTTSITHTGSGVLDSISTLPIYVKDFEFNDTNYPDFFALDLGWSVALDYDDPTGHWVIRNGGNEAGLTRPERYEENFHMQEYIDLINSIP